MLIGLGFRWHTKRYCAWQLIWRHDRACQFGHMDRHAFAAQTVWYPRKGGCNHLRIRAGVTALLVLAAIDLAAQRASLQQDVFHTKTQAFVRHILRKF